MNKTLFILISILIVLLSTIFIMININVNTEKEVAAVNNYYEKYLDKTFLGSEVATLISKAIDNNEKYGVEKDKSGIYISDGNNSIKLFIKILGSNKIYEMETINKVGISQFVSNFNVMTFKCSDIKYHNTKRVSEIFIEEIIE